MKLENWLERSAATVPERTALVVDGERVTYLELERRAVSAARRLARLGVGRGDGVALVLEPSGEYVVLLHAVMKIGAVAIPLDPRLGPAELDLRLAGVSAGLVIKNPAQVADASEAELSLDSALDLDAVYSVIHTSGSGGRARAVELTYGNHLWSALGSGVRIGIDPHDRWLCCLALHHIGGLAIILRSALCGTTVLLERFEAEAIAELIRTEKPTLVSLVATMLQRLLAIGADLDGLRCVLLGGGPAPLELIEQALESGVPIAPTYGLTEAASQVTTLPPGEVRRKPDSAGTPILPSEVRIDEGVILVRGATVSATAADPDGWLRTGDLGHLDDDGHLHVLGRADEVIVTGGENVSPEEVEQVLASHPGVSDVAVAAREDPEWQQSVAAIVVLRQQGSVSEEDLREFCRARLAGYKVPKQITFTARMPRDAHGKLQRRKLPAVSVHPFYTSSIFYDDDADLSFLRGKTVAIMGYGSQGHAHALNLKDSGVDVVVGLRPDSASRADAKAAGVRVLDIADAASEGDIVMVLLPDEKQAEVWEREIRDGIAPGNLLLFAHGFTIHFGQIEPSPEINVGMVAPKGPGHLVRRQFTEGRGVPCLVAIHQDASGSTRESVLAYAKAIGGTRAGVIETTFKDEAETDLFGEQSVLCGGATELVRAGFETLVEAGYDPRLAYFECLHELKLIVDLMYEKGITGMRDSISNTAEYGDLTRGNRVIGPEVKEAMKKILADIQSGEFAKEWIAENRAGQENFQRLREEQKGHQVEQVGKDLRSMMPWISGS